MPHDHPLRRSIQCAYANGGLWGVGSGMASVTLVAYFARELNASGTAIGWIIATPALVGLLRLLTPLWLDRVASRRRFCVGMFLASSAAAAALPALAAPGGWNDPRWSIVALTSTWTAYQVLEQMAVIALWSWLGDLVPPPIRGRFIGRREACMTAGVVVGSLVAAAATWWWDKVCVDSEQPELAWRSYAACASFGAAMLALATLPLTRMNELPRRSSAAESRVTLGDLLRPFADRRFRRFLFFGLWFSIANGLIQTPRQIFLASVLQLQFAEKKALDGASRGLQVLLLPWTGNVVDRRGSVPVLTLSWAIVAMAPAFLLLASPAAPWWVVGAYACWIAYAGINVTFPNLMLGLSRPGETPAYAAAWFAWTQLAFALAVLGGGAALDWMSVHIAEGQFSGVRVDRFAVLFALQWLLATAGIAVARQVPEPAGGDGSRSNRRG